MGARLGEWFQLKGLICTEACYELYAVETLLDTRQTYEARAYAFQGLKNKERNFRIRNFKRCTANSFFVQSIEQVGRERVISRIANASQILDPVQKALLNDELTPTVLVDHEDASTLPIIRDLLPKRERIGDCRILDPSLLPPMRCDGLMILQNRDLTIVRRTRSSKHHLRLRNSHAEIISTPSKP